MKPGLRLALLVAGSYFALSVLWIVMSDRAAATLSADAALMSNVQTLKGLGFVLVSALLMGAFVAWYERALHREVVSLRAAEQRFTRFFDHSPLAAWITGRDGELGWHSKGFQKDLWTGANRARLWTGIDAVIKDKRSLVGIVHLERARGRDGDYLVHRFLADDTDDCIGFVAVDVTDRVLSAEHLRSELDALVHVVSHDLRAPLRSLAGFTTALREDCGERLGDEGSHFVTRIQQAAEAMSLLIDGLLELSGVSRQSVQRQPVDVALLARNEIKRFESREQHRRVEFKSPASLPVTGDPRMLSQAIAHLIDNAWKYTAGCDVGRISLTCEQSDGKSVIVIADNGAGFDMAYADKLFTPFQRLHGVEDFPGAGIGLAVTERIIQRHGGRISLESKPGEGTTVRFTIG
ncbi:MAG: ATP-binding protein [Gammaproteobacteria bacterium]